MESALGGDAGLRTLMVGPTHPHGGGIVHYTHGLTNALARRPGLAPELVTYTRLFPSLLYKGTQDTGEQSLPLQPGVPVRRLLHYGNLLAWRRAALATVGAAVVHLQVWTPFLSPSMTPLALRARRRGAHVVATLHNAQPHDDSPDRRFNFLTTRLLRHADHVLVHTQGMAEAAMAAYRLPAGKVRVVPMATFAGFDRGAFTRTQARRQLGLRPEDVVGLMFGAIRPYKGVEVALEALARLPPHFKLLVAGKTWENWDAHDRRIHALGLEERVTARTDYIPDSDVELYHKAADAALFPYVNFEAQSAAGMTAVSFGLPIVASDLGGFHDLVDPAFLVPPGEPVQLAEAFARAAARGRPTTRAGATPTWDDVAARMQALYLDWP